MNVMLICFAVLILPAGGWAGQVVSANFDDLPADAVVGAYYPGMLMGARTYPRDWARSAPHVAGGWSAVGCSFPVGASWVSFYQQGVSSMRVYDTAGTMMDFYIPQGAYPWAVVDLRYERPIGSLDIISWDGLMGFYYLDDFSYEIVPEPASLAGLGLGLAGLVGWRGRRRN